MKSNQVVNLMLPSLEAMETQNDLSLVYFKPQIPEIKSYFFEPTKTENKKI